MVKRKVIKLAIVEEKVLGEDELISVKDILLTTFTSKNNSVLLYIRENKGQEYLYNLISELIKGRSELKKLLVAAADDLYTEHLKGLVLQKEYNTYQEQVGKVKGSFWQRLKFLFNPEMINVRETTCSD